MKTHLISNKQLEYYTTNNINPVDINTVGQRWNNHVLQRANLYENHLKIPSSWFQGKQVLEFGPNGGENALIYALNGANVILVEPHQSIHPRIHGLFSEAGMSQALNGVYAQTIESFSSKNKYDLVVAEGFIHALDNRKEIIQRLCSFSLDRVIFTYSDRYGYFFESLKRYIFHKILLNEAIDDWNKQYAIAKDLFYEQYATLNSARSFESWVKDILMNPCQTSDTLDRLDDLLVDLDEYGFKYVAGSPAWDTRHLNRWYKNFELADLFDEYNRHVAFFVTGESDAHLHPNVLELIASYTDYFLDYSCDRKVSRPCADFVGVKWQHAKEMAELMAMMDSEPLDQIIKFYTNSIVSSMWGMPHHYVCLAMSPTEKHDYFH